MAGLIPAGGGGASEYLGVVDGSSPLDVQGVNSVTINPSEDYDELIIIPTRQRDGFQKLRVNGITTGYSAVAVDGGSTAGTGYLELGNSTDAFRSITIGTRPLYDYATFYTEPFDSNASATVSGRCTETVQSLDSVTLHASTQRGIFARVLGRSYS